MIRRYMARELTGLMWTPRGRFVGELVADGATGAVALAGLVLAVLAMALVMPGA